MSGADARQAGDAAERLRLLADGVLDSLAGTPPAVLHVVASALALADGPIARFAAPLESAADLLEFDGDRSLARLQLARALRVVARDPGFPAMLDRIRDVGTPPWPAVYAALLEFHDPQGSW